VHLEIWVKVVKYSTTRIGFRYTILYVLAILFFLLFFNSEITLFSSLLLSLIMIQASILSDKQSIMQLLRALNIVGIRRKEIIVAFILFTNIRLLIMAIPYVITALINAFSLLLLLYFVLLSNAFIILYFYTIFRGGKE